MKTERLLEQMSLWQYKDLSPFQLSQGQQRRLALAILFSVQHKILLLDEPTYGQDRIHAVEIMNLIVDYAKENQSTVVLTSHDSELMQHYATRKVVLGV